MLISRNSPTIAHTIQLIVHNDIYILLIHMLAHGLRDIKSSYIQTYKIHLKFIYPAFFFLRLGQQPIKKLLLIFRRLSNTLIFFGQSSLRIVY